MDHLEMVEKLREKANVSYEEATQALEACDWDLLDALLMLESEGRLHEIEEAAYTTREEKAEPEKEEAKRKNRENGLFATLMKGLGSLIQKGQMKKVLYCNNESVSRGLLTAMNEAGIRVGEEIYLFTANSGPDSFCRFMTPSVTTIDLRMQEVFEQGLKLLLGIINHHEDGDTVTTIAPRYVYRDSMPELVK